MDTKPEKSTTNTAQTPDNPTAPSSEAPAFSSAWESYLFGKKTLASRFLAKVEADRRKGGITIPDEPTNQRCAEALIAKPDRITRLNTLLHESPGCSDTVRRIVLDLAQTAIKRLGIITLPEPLDPSAYRHAVSSWLAGIRKKPLKPAELNLLFLLLHFGLHRQLLAQDEAFGIVASAVKPERKTQLEQSPSAKPPPVPLDVLLATTPTPPVLQSLLALSDAWKWKADRQSAQIQSQAAEIEGLKSECATLKQTISNMAEEISALQKQNSASQSKIAELEREILDLRDGYQHKLDELRGRLRGVLQGQLTRWLQTALDASRSDPPWTQAIHERLEDALKLIEKETTCLQPMG